MLHHIALPDPDDPALWLVGYIVPGTRTVSVVTPGYSERAATSEARRLNQASERAAERLKASAIEPRKIPTGFYTDADAA